MAKLKWDQTGAKTYEHGDKNMALYISPGANEVAANVNTDYKKGEAWDGITGLTITASGAEETALWADDIKYGSLRSAEENGLTIEAYKRPDAFEVCDGTITIVDGVLVGQQVRRSFGCAFVTTIGNDTQGDAYGEKLHLMYNLTANPSERAYTTINDSPEAMTLSWECTSTPIEITYNGVTYKPSAHIEIDSTKLVDGVNNAKYKELKEALFGKDPNPDEEGDTGSDPYLPKPEKVFDIMKTGTSIGG